MPCPSFSIVYRQIDIIEFTGPDVWSVSDKHQFADKRQKMKGRAPKVSYLSRKVGWKSWRPFGCSVKNAQFHLTKQLYWWVLNLEVEWYSTSSIFWLSNIFNFFVPGSPASSKLTKCNQVLSSVIKGYQVLSSFIMGFQVLSSVFNCFQVVSSGIIFYQV